VLTLAIMAVPAEPAEWAVLRTGAVIAAAGVPVLLAALP
jgi:hypothetical protein